MLNTRLKRHHTPSGQFRKRPLYDVTRGIISVTNTASIEGSTVHKTIASKQLYKNNIYQISVISGMLSCNSLKSAKWFWKSHNLNIRYFIGRFLVHLLLHFIYCGIIWNLMVIDSWWRKIYLRFVEMKLVHFTFHINLYFCYKYLGM